MRKLLIALAALAMMSFANCSCASYTTETLDKAGYSNIETNGWSVMGCSDEDTFATKFTADNPAGKRVNGVVCCGWFAKGCTIRF